MQKIPKYILDYSSDSPTYQPDCPELREEMPLDKTLRPNAERYVLLSDLKPHIEYLIRHEYYEMEYDAHLQALYDLFPEFQ